MRHVRVLAQPIGRFNTFLLGGVQEHAASRLQLCGLRILYLLCIEEVAVAVIRFFLVVHEEIDAGSKEVDGRGLEELVRAAATLLLSFLQGFNQCFRCFLCSSQIIDILLLYWVHPS